MQKAKIKVIKKRPYSRSGCLECKKRKIKCDEGKPACHNCLKINKPCSFVSNGPANGSPGPEVSPAYSSSVGLPQINSVKMPYSVVPGPPVAALGQPPMSTQSLPVHEPQYQSPSQNSVASVQQSPEASVMSRSKASTMSMSYSNGPVYDHTIMSSMNDQLYNGASVLANDLNELLDVNPEDLLQFEGHDVLDLGTAPADKKAATPTISGNYMDEESLSNLIAAFDMIQGHKNYLRIFYEKYSLWLMPLCPEPGPRNFFNKVILQKAQEVPFLFNAVFAIAASFEHKETGSEEDEHYKRYYISLSLKGLNAVFSEKDKVIEHIEPLILTSLLYVTDTASTTNGSWRDHLHGSNELFRQYLSLKGPAAQKTNPMILLSTSWFASFEIIAVVTNTGGGSINNQNHLEDILSPILDKDNMSVAIQIGFVLPNGYNVFLGQSLANIRLFIYFLGLTIKIKKSPKQVIGSDDFVELMSYFDEALKFCIASHDGIIHRSSPYYPQTSGMSFLPLETYGYTKDIVFSWFDLSDKIHIRGLYLRVLTSKFYCGLPVASPLVQDVVKKILDMCHFFHGINFEDKDFDAIRVIAQNPILKDRRLLMLHSSFVICGLCSMSQTDRRKVELYFKSLISLGARTVENSYRIVFRSWEGDEETVDYVPYI